MGYSFNGWSRGSTVSGTGYQDFGNSGSGGQATESNSQYKMRVPGTFSGLYTVADAVGTARSITFRKNTAAGNQTLVATDTTAGVYQDTTHTDAVVATDLISLQTVSTGNAFFRWIRQIFKASTNHAAIYIAAASTSTSTASSTLFLTGVGFSQSSTTETFWKTRIRAAGTLQNAQFNCTAARATNSAFRSRINGAYGTINATLTGSTTGLFEDTTHTDSLAAGDDWNWAFDTGTGADNLSGTMVGATIVNPTASQNDIFWNSLAATRAASATTSYYLPFGQIGADTTEANKKFQHGFPVRTTNLRVMLSANTYSVSATATIRKNGADGAQTYTITNAITGLFEDTSHSDDFAATDDCCWSVTGGSSGSISYVWGGLTEQDTTAPFPPFPQLSTTLLTM